MKMTDKSNESMRKFREQLSRLPGGVSEKFVEKLLKESLGDGTPKIGITRTTKKSKSKRAMKMEKNTRKAQYKLAKKVRKTTGSKRRV